MSDTVFEQVTKLADQLTPEEKLELIKRLTGSTRKQPVNKPRSLYGIWRGKVPADLDIEGSLNEIRSEWKKEWPEIFEK